MKLNLKNSILSVLVLASLVGCGSDGGSGSSYGTYTAGTASSYVGTAKGLPSSLNTADELSAAIVNNNFSSSSIGGRQYGIYTVTSFESSSSSADCDEIEVFGVSLGTYCTNSSSSSNGSSLSGYRGLYTNGEIARSSSSLDGAFGDSMAELATYLANKVQESDSNGTLYKYVQGSYGSGFAPYKDGMCDNTSWVNNYYNGNTYICNQVAQINSALWMVTINSKKMIIDMTSSLIQQPTVRATSVGISAY